MVFTIKVSPQPKGETPVKNTSKVAFVLLIAASILSGACNGSKNNAKQPSAVGTPVIASAAASFNYGQVEEGTKVEHVFIIQNTGDGLLIIKKATGS
ncbi:MAG: DUF1573 domain-containing protein [Proteobacteria bacterium]|nr:DUF1573 domain-containing protein [Pseudomonadota bacterium]